MARAILAVVDHQNEVMRGGKEYLLASRVLKRWGGRGVVESCESRGREGGERSSYRNA